MIVKIARGKVVGTSYGAPQDTLIIVCHGFLASRKHSLILDFAHACEAAGIFAFTFDFSGYGDSQGKMEDSTYSRQVHDIGEVIEHWGGAVKRFILVGHSKGGAVAMKAANTVKNVVAVVNIAGIVHGRRIRQERFPEGIVEKAVRYGKVQVTQGRHLFTLTKEYVEDGLKHDSFTDVDIAIPKLIIHGRNDTIIPVSDGEELFRRAAKPKELLKYDADHNFSNRVVREKMISDVVRWIHNYL